jgi:hypothetical protein
VSDRLSLDVVESDIPLSAWPHLLSVLNGSARPAHDTTSAKLVNKIATQPCDVRLRPGRFELWHLARCRHHQYKFEAAAPVLFQLMRLLGVTRVAGPHVGLMQRAGLGSHFPEHDERAVWIVPSANEIEIFVREAPSNVRGPHVALPAPSSGPWAVPVACTRNEVSYTRASSECPHCRTRPDFFRELPNQGALVCTNCGRSFAVRASRF